jgi:hypothetical protein
MALRGSRDLAPAGRFTLDRRAGLGAVVTLLTALSALAAPKRPETRSATREAPVTAPEATPAEFPSVKDPLAAQVTSLEKELAGRMLHRSEASGGPAATAELLIDLRIIQRWMLVEAAKAKPQSAGQIALLLRATELASAIAGVEDAMKRGAALTRTQTDAMAQIHKLSFDLGELKEPGQLDEICKRLGYALANATTPAGVDARSIPLMRPKRTAEAGGDTADALPQDAPGRTIADLSADITRAPISTTLRQQLLALAQAASAASTAAATDPKREPEAATLYQVLAIAVELTRGLSNTTAFPPDDRSRLETQLAEGLALFADPRTRSAGRDRVEQLNQYRLVMNRIAHSRLSPDLRRALAPALVCAQTHAAGEQGQKLLRAIEGYAAVCERLDTAPKHEAGVANLRRPKDDLFRQIEQARQQFVQSANDATASLVSFAIDGLENQLADLSQLAELYAALDGMQQTYDLLNAYKPKPFGAMEQRALKAALAATATARSPARTAAIQFLLDLAKLGQLSAALTQRSFADIPAPVLQAYAGISTGELEAKCRAVMGDLVNQVAGGGEMDRSRIARLRSVGELCDGLRIAASAERALAAAPALHKWVDWSISQTEARGLLDPYRQLLAAAFADFITETPLAVEKFIAGRDKYLPLITLLKRDSELADQCAALPDGLTGDLARLMTPIEGQPFGTERYLSYVTRVWQILADDDPDAADAVLEQGMARLQREVRVSIPDLIGPAPATTKSTAK